MNAKVFVDTNVLVYFRDGTEPEKQRWVSGWLTGLWQQRLGVLSFQVLQEYYVTVTRKLDPGLTAAEARDDIRSLLAWNPMVPDRELLEAAWRIQDRFGISWWDSTIVAAAQRLGAGYLLSEDFQEGMDFEGVKVINPFRTAISQLAD